MVLFIASATTPAQLTQLPCLGNIEHIHEAIWPLPSQTGRRSRASDRNPASAGSSVVDLEVLVECRELLLDLAAQLSDLCVYHLDLVVVVTKEGE
jgi:hypothetical protein